MSTEAPTLDERIALLLRRAEEGERHSPECDVSRQDAFAVTPAQKLWLFEYRKPLVFDERDVNTVEALAKTREAFSLQPINIDALRCKVGLAAGHRAPNVTTKCTCDLAERVRTAQSALLQRALFLAASEQNWRVSAALEQVEYEVTR